MLEIADDLGTLERRIAATQQLRHLARAIAALARAQLPSAEQAALRATEYFDEVDTLVDQLVGAPDSRAAGEYLHVVVGPERPFCGPLAAQAAAQAAAQLPDAGMLGIVGERLAQVVAGDSELAHRVLFRLPGAVGIDEAEAVAAGVARAVLGVSRGTIVELLHPTNGGATLHRSTLLASQRRPRTTHFPETFSPTSVIVKAAIQESVVGRLTLAVVEALRSETLARIAAAEQMRDTCDAKLEALEQGWRVARQEAITNELLEVVAGRRTTRAQS